MKKNKAMKKIKYVLVTLVLMIAASAVIAQQTDSIYTYSYNCDSCGTFTTYSTAPIDLETSSMAVTDSLNDSSTVTVVSFNNTAPRKAKTNKIEKTRFAVYPNPAKHTFYINIDVPEAGKATIELIDITGRTMLIAENKLLRQGMNVIAQDVAKLKEGNYFLKLYTSKNVFNRKIVIVR